MTTWSISSALHFWNNLFIYLFRSRNKTAMLGLIVNLLSMTIPAVVTVHVFRSAERMMSTFNFHPVYMSFGYLFLATQAMLFLYFNTDNVIKYTTEETDRKSKIRLHTWINLTSSFLIALGFIGNYLYFFYTFSSFWIITQFIIETNFGILIFEFVTVLIAFIYSDFVP